MVRSVSFRAFVVGSDQSVTRGNCLHVCVWRSLQCGENADCFAQTLALVVTQTPRRLFIFSLSMVGGRRDNLAAVIVWEQNYGRPRRPVALRMALGATRRRGARSVGVLRIGVRVAGGWKEDCEKGKARKRASRHPLASRAKIND